MEQLELVVKEMLVVMQLLLGQEEVVEVLALLVVMDLLELQDLVDQVSL
jgi:hypothetical protein